jgi:hypothetical protein
VGQVLDDLGQVSARFPLKDDGDHEKVDIRAVHPAGQVFQGFGHAHAEVDLIQGLLELGPRGSPNSSEASFMPLVKAWPARKALAINPNPSGSCFSNLAILFFFFDPQSNERKACAPMASKQRKSGVFRQDEEKEITL